MSIILNWGSQLSSHFLKAFQVGIGNNIKLSNGFETLMDGQAKHIIKTIEDMLRMSPIDFMGSWDYHVPLIYFAYNNSYHSSVF